MSTYFEKKSHHPDRKGGRGGSTLTVSLTVKRPFFILTTSLNVHSISSTIQKHSEELVMIQTTM